MGQPSDELIEKIWSALVEKQESINKQMEESEKKFFQRAEENRLLQERIERKYFDRLEESRLLVEQTERKYFDRLEEKDKQLKDIWEKILQELEANRILAEEKNSKKTRRKQYLIEMAEHPVYSAILRLFLERGYKIDSETLKLYWEMITIVTRSAEPPGDSGQTP